MKNTRRRQVLGVIETARAFLFVAEIAIPVRLITILAVVARDNLRQIGITLPCDGLIADAGREPKCGIFMMQ